MESGTVASRVQQNIENARILQAAVSLSSVQDPPRAAGQSVRLRYYANPYWHTTPLTREAIVSLPFCFNFQNLRCIVSKDKVARFGLLVAREAAFHKRRVASFAVCKVTEPPPAGCSVFL
jgi:hypothetical protein